MRGSKVHFNESGFFSLTRAIRVQNFEIMTALDKLKNITAWESDPALTEDELLCFLKERLGRFKLPRVIQIQTEALPKTGTGKIRKMILKERFWAGKEKRVQG